jgi:hypothetical protein
MPPTPKIHTQDQVETLIDLYLNKKMSTNEISEKSKDHFGIYISGGTIYKELIRYKIPVRSMSESISRAMSTLNMDESYLDEKTVEWIDGFLLGDGSISFNKATHKSARFSFGSPEKDWVNYAMSGLNKYNPIDATSDGWKFRPEKPCRPTFVSRTKMHPDISMQAKRWYPRGKKIVPQDVRITPISILLWYLGDGSVGRHRRRGEVFSTNLSLATCGFTPEENKEILIPKLSKLGIRCLYGSSKNDIIICPDSIKTFFYIIGHKSPISCYDHKFNIPEWLFLKTLSSIIPDKKERWKALYYLKNGKISCSKSPGGHYFLFNEDHEKELLNKMKSIVK